MTNMPQSPTLKIAYLSGIIGFALAILGFYTLQNQAGRLGGGISLPKACWLGLAIFHWYFLPALLLCDKRCRQRSPSFRRFFWGIGVFFTSMLLRAFIELYLMYGNQAWHYEYGIVHNVLSIVILLVVIIAVEKAPPNEHLPMPLKITLHLLLLMFFAESYFASYMIFGLENGHRDVIWFIDGSAKHTVNNAITTAMVSLLSVWQIFFYNLWMKQ